MARVLLDVASGWPLREPARRAWLDAQPLAVGDPTRGHVEGSRARELLDRATGTVAARLGGRSEDLVWTSGGTEAAAHAVLGPLRAAAPGRGQLPHLVVSAVEHSAVLRSARRAADEGLAQLTIVGVDGAGSVDPDAVEAALRPTTVAVHLQHANHEVGTLQPTHEVSVACRRHGVALHVDACQSVGQLGVTLEQLGADLLSFSSAKHGGPRGVGGLLLGPRARVAPLLVGDGRQRGLRAGALDVASVAAAAVALEDATTTLDADRSARELVRRHLRQRLAELEDVAVHGPLAEAHPGIVAASALYVAGDALVAALDERGWAVSSGSSCATDGGDPSHVLVAMRALTHGHLRVSFGPWVDVATADAFVDDVAEVVTALRASTGRRTRR